MASALLVGACALLLGTIPSGTELQYSGKLLKGDETGNTEKTFSLTATLGANNRLYYLVEERGGPGWNWPQRFGVIDLGNKESAPIRLLYSFDGSPTPLPVRRPIFDYPEQLMAEKEWNGAGEQLSIRGTRTAKERELTVIEVTMDRGRRQQLEVETSSGVLVSLQERLFMGRGDAFHLTMQLDHQRQLTSEDLAKTTQAVDQLVKLQAELTPPDSQQRSQLTTEDLVKSQTLVAGLDFITDSVWGRFAQSIQRDLVAQSRRLEGIAALSEKFIGRAIETPDTWKQLNGQPLPHEQWRGHTTVLHFWDYNGDKLVEPYGQVGYLDFLNNRRQRLGVHVIGIAVDNRFGDPAQSKTATRTARKLQEFMNISYPIVADDGAILSRFGDPRSIGGELPLWVVIDYEGKIAHYHVGTYQLQPDEGLKTLDLFVVDALKREKMAERQ